MEGRTTVLLIEDNPGDAVLIREMLLEAPDAPFAVQWADQLGKGLSRIAQGRVDAVLLDLALPDSSGLETFVRLHHAAPGIPVIVLSGQNDDSLALDAVRQGAEDYLVKGSVSGDSLARSVRHAIERNARQIRGSQAAFPHANPGGRVLGLIGAKGGVGTTTVVLNVAAALAQKKVNVLAAELRASCGTLSHHFQRQVPHANVSALLDLAPAQINENLLSAHLAKYSSGFRVLFGPQRAAEVKPLSGEMAGAITGALARMAEFVVLDLPAAPSAANEGAVRGCHFVGLVLEREPSSLALAEVMLDHLNQWAPEVPVGAVVVHRQPLSVPLEIDLITRTLGVGIIGLIPPAADACLLSQRAGSPVVTTYADSLIADSFQQLAGRLSEEFIVLRKTA